MKALYRRYRPQSLAEVVGQSQITNILANSLKNQKISHAYLFIGPRGTGKTSVARIFAHAINDFKYELEDDYLDIIEIDGASNRGIDNIRDLREKALIAPTKGKYKVYIIDEVHMLTREAFNALLKLLEEPPLHVVFLMATTDAHKVPITITSRSQIFTFHLADPDTMFKHLKKIAKTEKIPITDEALQLIVHHGGGSFRDSLSLLDQVSALSDKKIDLELLTNALGLPSSENIQKLLTAYTTGDLAALRSTLTALTDTGVKTELIIEKLIDAILTDPRPELLSLLDRLTDIPRTSYPDVKLLLALATPIISTPLITTPPAPTATIASPIAAKSLNQTPKPKLDTVTAPKPKKPQKTSTKPKSQDMSTFDPNNTWQNILARIDASSPSLKSYIHNADYEYKDQVFTIYARQNFAKTQINKKINSFSDLFPENITLKISSKTLPQSPTMADIMDIMGGGEAIDLDEQISADANGIEQNLNKEQITT